MRSQAPLRRGRDQTGMTLVEMLIVVAVLGALAAVVLFATGLIRERAHDSTCRAERRVLLNALETTRATNFNHEYPGVGGVDGFDRVREAGYLEWGTSTRYWRYATPPLDGRLTSLHLQRIGVEDASLSTCQF
jgi:prepilin-type N-terminal cleavage/methylation domain-containing protein